MGQQKRNSQYTVMVVPHSQKPPVAFKLPLLAIQALAILIVFVPVAMVGFFNNYYSAQSFLPELEDLRLDNQLKSEQIEALANETQLMLENLQRLQQLEQKLRELTDLDDEAVLFNLEDVANETANNPVTFRDYTASRSGYTTVERTLSGISHLQSALPEQEDRMENLKEDVEEQLRREAATPSIWPTWGRISSGFGWRRHPVTGRRDFHNGIDITGRNIHGRAVYATATGRVSFAGYRRSYGYLIIIEHGYGFTTYYAHLSRVRVRAGQQVEKGQLIGNVGNTGSSTGPHLHYEVRAWGNPVDPRKYLP